MGFSKTVPLVKNMVQWSENGANFVVSKLSVKGMNSFTALDGSLAPFLVSVDQTVDFDVGLGAIGKSARENIDRQRYDFGNSWQCCIVDYYFGTQYDRCDLQDSLRGCTLHFIVCSDCWQEIRSIKMIRYLFLVLCNSYLNYFFSLSTFFY